MDSEKSGVIFRRRGYATQRTGSDFQALLLTPDLKSRCPYRRSCTANGSLSQFRMPVNVLLIRASMSFYLFYGDNFKIECPTGSGKSMKLFEVAHEIANPLERIFLRD